MKVNSQMSGGTESFMLSDRFLEPGGQDAMFHLFLKRRS